MSAADRRRMATQLELLDALLRSPNRRASLGESSRTNDAAFPDRGPWRGSAIAELSRDGLIRRVGAAKSKRPSRHGTIVSLWESLDDHGCRKRANRLRDLLDDSAHDDAQP